jgi:hypothetical protein
MIGRTITNQIVCEETVTFLLRPQQGALGFFKTGECGFFGCRRHLLNRLRGPVSCGRICVDGVEV